MQSLSNPPALRVNLEYSPGKEQLALSSQHLLNEALKKRKPLKKVGSENLPECLGGTRRSFSQDGECALKHELVRKALQVHQKLEGQLLAFRRIKEKADDDYPENNKLFSDIRACKSLNPPLNESPLRPKFALDRIVQSRPGWTDLQVQVRSVRKSALLNQVEFEGFYILRPSSCI